MPPGLIGSVVPMLWTFELKPCVSAVKLNAERAADDFHLNAHATIVYILGGCPFHGRVERDEIPT